MKYAPKKVFILENGNYEEITYQELCDREETSESYKDKLFLPLHGMLMEVTEKTYKEYYREKRRQKYITECAKKNGEFSYNALDTDEFSGEDVLVASQTDVSEQVEQKLLIEKIREARAQLLEDERILMDELYLREQTERALAERYGVSQVAIHKRKNRILAKLRKFLEN